MAPLRKTEVGWVRITQQYVMLCEQNDLPHGPNPARISSCSVAKNNHMNLQELFMAASSTVASEPVMPRSVCMCIYRPGPF